MYNDKEVQKLLDKLDIVQVISEYVTLKKTGANYKGLSPFREERTPSFVVSPVKNIFKDFSTGIGGNSITFYMKMNNISFVEAIEELSRKYNITMSKVVRKNDENNTYILKLNDDIHTTVDISLHIATNMLKQL